MGLYGVPVLNYHSVTESATNSSLSNVSVSLKSFREQMKWLHENGYKSLTEKELQDLLFNGIPPCYKRVLLTFDDGYYSLYQHALGVLADYGFTGLLFLSTSFIGRKYTQYDFEFAHQDRQLAWPEIKELAANGWTIQSHGYTHKRMTHLSTSAVIKEVTVSKKIIEHNLGTKVDSFAFPYGIYNSAVINQLINAGYTSAYTVHSGKLFPPASLFQLPRIEINNRDTLESYKLKVSTGFTSSAAQVRAKLRNIAFANPNRKDLIEKWLHYMGYGNR